ncbi:MAG TPA: DUF2167 domain-containing protein, partial [Haliscomenobacter sp.]|uniref:DUF2167 domain-containing protein n=1 Tax=Haliscomenobacter sp. TaxID=2717303 RepID=UPI002BD27D1F
MKKVLFSIIASIIALVAFAQDPDVQFQIDSIEKTFIYEHGTITLKNGIGQIVVPDGFKYLNPAQAERVIVDLWGNPGGENITLGLILPENQGVLSERGYVFNIQYDEIGYVKDNDADKIDYDELMTEMKKEAVEANKLREEQGYEPIYMVGWAAKPFYDGNKKILHWAKEIKFGTNEVNTLNYNVRVLGRKGVLVLNAIATMADLPLVKKDVPLVLDIVQFNDGFKYQDFDPKIDEVAAWTIGGLVAGKLLAKVGFFAVLLKFWKLIAIAVFGFLGAFWKKIKG